MNKKADTQEQAQKIDFTYSVNIVELLKPIEAGQGSDEVGRE